MTIPIIQPHRRIAKFFASTPVRAALLVLIGSRLLGAALLAVIEKINFWDALWFGGVTQTTTGYGDVYPETTWGRIITEGVLMWPSVIALLVLTGAIAGAIIREGANTADETADISDDILAIKEGVTDQLDRLDALTSTPRVEWALAQDHADRIANRDPNHWHPPPSIAEPFAAGKRG